MEILNLGGAAEVNSAAPKSRKKLRVLLGIGALAAVTGIGSTLAANISLNGGGNVEFGQGVATTAACDNDITLTPVSTFSNTEEESSFAMTAIQVSHIDLSPEGWDFSENGWADGYTPAQPGFEGSWASGYEQYAGEYRNTAGDWVKTCANKSLMIHAYTDEPDYDYATDDWDINSPLILNGADGHRPDNNYYENNQGDAGYNRGVGFRVDTFEFDGSWDTNYYLIVEDNGSYSSGANGVPLDRVFSPDGSGDTLDDSTFIIYLGGSLNSYPPVDSKMVDKLTIESAATIPNGWLD